MIANIQAKGVNTIYSMIGDLFIYLCFGFLTAFIIVITIRKPAGNKV
jgi:hypothetical protein